MLAFQAGGCGPELDRVYALPLDHAPTEADWSATVGLKLKATGGKTSQAGEADVDSDAVHASTASCHHGAKVPPVDVNVRAFYTTERLFLRIEWVDPTQDLGPSWTWDGSAWRAASPREDGLGILWGRDPTEFSCTRVCHLEDWRVAGPRAFADYRMGVSENSSPLDFWVWRAGRVRVGGAAEDARLGPRGREGDIPGDVYAPNSLRARTGAQGAFDFGDTPWQAPDPEPGARAPAYVSAGAPEHSWEVSGGGIWDAGRWRVTVSRGLEGEDPDDVRFSPGSEYVFGLATLDGVGSDHNAVPAPIRLVLVDAFALEPRGARTAE